MQKRAAWRKVRNWVLAVQIGLALLLAALWLRGGLTPGTAQAAPPAQDVQCDCTFPNGLEFGSRTCGDMSSAHYLDSTGGEVLVFHWFPATLDDAKATMRDQKKSFPNMVSVPYGEEALEGIVNGYWDLMFRRGGTVFDIRIESSQPPAAVIERAHKIALAIDANVLSDCQQGFRLDRAKATRYSSLLVKGSGFKPNENVNIMWEGKELFGVQRATTDGKIPDNTWIWVPDDAPIGVNKVWAEQGNFKTNEFEIEIYQVTPQQLISNFDALAAQYFKQIPANPYGYTSGRTYNLALDFPSISGMTDNNYACGGYQGQVLNFFDKIRFDSDINNRALLDGLDYAPLFSGVSLLWHAYVVVWPHGPALTPGAYGGNLDQATWSANGIAFDPWPKQKPELFALSSGSADWADASTYSLHWKYGQQKFYVLPTPIDPIGTHMYEGDFPITGASYYKSNRHFLAADLARLNSSFDQPSKALAVHSPVQLTITDPQGNQMVAQDNGAFQNAIQDSEAVSITESSGGHAWLIALPAGKMQVQITGTGTGSYQLMTKNAGQPLYEYPETPVTAGASAQVTLDDTSEHAPLRTGDGQVLAPVSKPQPGDNASPASPAARDQSSIALLAVVCLSVCGLSGLAVSAVGLAVWMGRRSRRGKHAQPAAAASPTAYAAPWPPNPPPPGYPPAPYPAYPPPPPPNAAPAPARLRVVQGAANYPWLELRPGGMFIGRNDTNHLALNDTLASRRHARIDFVNGAWLLSDLNSANGTFVNGKRIQQQALRPGDHIQIGNCGMVFEG